MLTLVLMLMIKIMIIITIGRIQGRKVSPRVPRG
jgi:hypothetical protein